MMKYFKVSVTYQIYVSRVYRVMHSYGFPGNDFLCKYVNVDLLGIFMSTNIPVGTSCETNPLLILQVQPSRPSPTLR